MDEMTTVDRRQDSGFTLIEALLSSVVIAVCVVAVASGPYRASRSASAAMGTER